MKTLTIALAWILIIQQTHYCLGVPRHRRRSNSLFVTEKATVAGPQQQQQQQQQPPHPWQPKFVPHLTDLTGSFSGTWTRLPDYDSGSSGPSGRRPSTAVDADAAAALASQRLESSGWPTILTRALSGRLLLKMHAGPANPQGVAGVEGVLSVSEGALVLGPALKRLSLSGFTRMDPDNRQGVYAVMSPQTPIRIAPPDYPASPVHVGRSTLSTQQPQPAQHSSHSQAPYHPQQQQAVAQQPSGWLTAWVRGRASQGRSSLSQQLAWLLRNSAGDETTAAMAAAASQQHYQQQQLYGVSECKFRLELTVTRADDFWVASAATNRAAAAAAAAVPSRAAMHSLHQKIGPGPDTQQGPQQQQQQQQQQQPQHHGQASADAAATGYFVQPSADVPFVDTISNNVWGVSWQQYFGAEEDAEEVGPQGPSGDQQQQQQQQGRGEQQQPPPHPASVGRRSAMEVPLPTGLANTVLQIPLVTPDSSSVGVLDEYEAAVAADADYAAGYEAGYAAAAAEAEAAATAAVAAAEAARNAAAAIAALPRQFQGAVRALKGRDFPGGSERMMLNGAATSAGGSWQQRSMIEQAQAYSAPAATAAPPSEANSEAVAAEAPQQEDGSSSRYGVRNLFDAWLLPCSHPKQRDTQACQQHLLSSTLHASSSHALEFGASSSGGSGGSSSSRQTPRLQIQGLLISDNCQARWALSATALPPGGLEVQALWYALLALLVCLLQVMLLRKQASIVTRSSAVALRVSLVGVCAGAQIDAFLSMAHLAASMSSPDISMPLLVVAAAQFALFAGADMTLLLHVWRAHDHHHQQQQRYQRQYTADAEEALAATNTTSRPAAAGSRGPDNTAVASVTTQWLAVGSHLGPYRPHNFMGLWAVPVLVVMASARQVGARVRWLCSGGRGSMGLFDSIVLGIEQLATGRSLLMLYIRFYLVLLSATVLSWFMTSQLPLLLLAAFSFWVPQIWHNIINTARQPLQPSYILVSTAARLLLPVYLLCCPLNLLQLTPQPWLAGALLAWVGLQVAVLLLQHYSHPHIILPASWAPVRYNYHRVEVPWQFKEAAAEAAAAAAKAAACVAYDPSTQSLTAPLPQEQPAGGGSGHLTCCCTGLSGACHLCSTRRYTIQQESYGNSGSCTIRFSPRRQSSAAGVGVMGVAGVALRTNRAMLATETPLVAAMGSSGSSSRGRSGPSSSWRLQTATSAPQQAAAAAQQAAELAGPQGQQLPCGNCGGKLAVSSCNSFCSGSRGGRPGAAAGATAAAGSSRWGVRHMSQQDMQHDPSHASLQGPAGYAGAYQAAGSSITRSISSGAQLQAHGSRQEIVPHQQQQQQQHQQLVLSLPPGASVELSSRPTCQHCCQQCSPAGSNSNSTCGWSPSSSPTGSSPSNPSPSPSSGASGEPASDDPLHDVVEGYDALTGEGVIECVICMAGVRLLPLSERFVTPCGHFFHPECLTSWMEVKAECPQCRGPLPPL